MADTILGTAKMIRDASHAHTVVVCQILHRNKVDTRYLTSVEELTKFNNSVGKANAFLKVQKLIKKKNYKYNIYVADTAPDRARNIQQRPRPPMH